SAAAVNRYFDCATRLELEEPALAANRLRATFCYKAHYLYVVACAALGLCVGRSEIVASSYLLFSARLHALGPACAVHDAAWGQLLAQQSEWALDTNHDRDRSYRQASRNLICR